MELAGKIEVSNSPKDKKFAQQAPWITRERAVPQYRNECRLLIAIQGLANTGSHICNATQITLSECSGVPNSNIPAVIRRLEGKGYIEIESWSGNWERRSNEQAKKHGRIQYVLCWDPERYYRYRRNAPERRRNPGAFSKNGPKMKECPF